MASQEQCVQTHGALRRARQPHDLKLRVGLQFISSLLLPLTLDVFTVVITFQQQSAAKQQRDEDRMAAELQRAEDQNASLMQRREYQDASRFLREQEQNMGVGTFTTLTQTSTNINSIDCIRVSSMNNQPMVQVTIPQITIMLFFICLVQSSTLSYSSTARTMGNNKFVQMDA
ncbi:unnamed protein product [Rotaria magnacalcarata]|uniref:Uncharacterized protein n=1 Tax=Rotaria magnacalcarata TaxID=392030 RepID=A0A816KJ37_9BILA|nr:unnamed protein product [Rotaria magnacalcarata]